MKDSNRLPAVSVQSYLKECIISVKVTYASLSRFVAGTDSSFQSHGCHWGCWILLYFRQTIEDQSCLHMDFQW